MRVHHGRRARLGFTLIEVMVTIAIIALFLTIVSTYFAQSVRAARERGVPERFLQDFGWARSAAATARAGALVSSLSGVPTLTLTVGADCTWTASINGTANVAHSLTSAQLGSSGASLGCSGMALPATFAFDNQGGVSTTGSITFIGTTNTWTLQVLASGVVVRTKVAS